MPDICVIPCWQRAPLLAVCLEKILEADDLPDMFLFAVDRHCGEELDEQVQGVIASSRLFERSRVEITRQHPYHGNSFNVITALRDAATEENLVFYVEDDIMVSKDFFKWHREIHQQYSEIAASVAVRSPDNSHHVGFTQNSEDFYVSFRDYSALGSCFKGRIIRNLLSGLDGAYYSSPITYCKMKFPLAPFPDENAEQDGLIRRLLWNAGLGVAWPHVPRTFHLGWYGYHRDGMKPWGVDLQAQIAFVKRIMYDGQALNGITNARDIVPCSLEVAPWTRLNLTASYSES